MSTWPAGPPLPLPRQPPPSTYGPSPLSPPPPGGPFRDSPPAREAVVSLLREYHDAEAAVARRAVPARGLRHVHAAPGAWALVLYQFAAEPYSVIAMAAGPPRRRPAHLHVCR